MMTCEQLLHEMPFYYVSTFELNEELFPSSQRVRDDKFQNNIFYDCLTSATNSEHLKQLDFGYYSVDKFNNRTSRINDKLELSVFHLNIRSLNKNQVELYNLLQSINLKFDVIVLSEIWNYNLDFCHSLFRDYSFYYDISSEIKVGGIGVYVNNAWNCNVINKYKFARNDDGDVENIWLEVSKAAGKCKYIIGGIYTHPNSNIDNFNSMLETTLCKIREKGTACIVAGDINIDLCKYSTHTSTTDYVNTLLAYNFLPVIVMPTRITTVSSTLIDHMYCGRPAAVL